MTTYLDVEISLGRSITDQAERAQVEKWIGYAELQIRKRLGDLTLLDQEALDYVVTEAVVLKVKRPDPAQRVEIAVDDGRIARSYDKDTGQVTILPEWWALLSPDEGNPAIFSVRPGFEPDAPPLDSWL